MLSRAADKDYIVISSVSQGLVFQILAAFVVSGSRGAVVDLSKNAAHSAVNGIKKEVKDVGLS